MLTHEFAALNDDPLLVRCSSLLGDPVIETTDLYHSLSVIQASVFRNRNRNNP